MNVYQHLEQLRIEAHVRKHNKPVHRYFTQEFRVKRPKSAAQLESLICELIEKSGGVCTVIYSGGRQLFSQQKVKDVLGNTRTLTDQKYIPSSTEAGTSDLIASIPGIEGAVYLEVKFAKSDRQRDTQKKFENKVTSRGFQYHIVRCLDDVLTIINK